MKIRYLASFEGPGVSIRVGDVRNVSMKEASRLLQYGRAELVREGQEVESRPEQKPVERAISRGRPKRKV